jgi:hypothetical protein
LTTINEMMTTITLMNDDIAYECMRCINDIAIAYLDELCVDEHIHPSVINEIFNTHFPEGKFDYWKDICDEDDAETVYDFVNSMETHVNEKSNDKKNIENLKKVMIDLQEVGMAIYRNI